VTNIISCVGYEEDFLKEMGFQNREDCEKINLVLYNQYLDDCSKTIKLSDESEYKKLLGFCVYHSFEKNIIGLTSEYLFYKRKGLNK